MMTEREITSKKEALEEEIDALMDKVSHLEDKIESLDEEYANVEKYQEYRKCASDIALMKKAFLDEGLTDADFNIAFKSAAMMSASPFSMLMR